jgi:hypothetical protein
MLRTTLLAATAAVITFTTVPMKPAEASVRNDGLTTIWVTIHAYPGEGLWEACRRVYRRDVYKVRGGPDVGLVQCDVDHSRIYN